MSKSKLNRSTIRRVLALIRPYAGSVALTLTLAVITVFTTLLAPVISGKAVDLILGPGQVDFVGLGKLAVAMAATILCTAVAQWLMNVVNNRITFQVVRDIRIQAFQQLEILPLKYMDAHRPGDAISRSDHSAGSGLLPAWPPPRSCRSWPVQSRSGLPARCGS